VGAKILIKRILDPNPETVSICIAQQELAQPFSANLKLMFYGHRNRKSIGYFEICCDTMVSKKLKV